MLTRLIVLSVVLFGRDGASAQQYLAFGAGNESCAAWLDNPASERLGEEFVAGLWSGLNAANARGTRMVGSSTDTKGRVGEVKHYCLNRPSTTLIDATMTVWVDFQRKEAR